MVSYDDLVEAAKTLVIDAGEAAFGRTMQAFLDRVSEWHAATPDVGPQAAALVAVAAGNIAARVFKLPPLRRRAVVGHFARAWEGSKSPALLRYVEEMLSPDNADLFESKLSAASFVHLRQEAQARLDAEAYSSPQHKLHLMNIVRGTAPFGWTVEKETP